MAKYIFKYWYEWGGTCLWSANDTTIDKFDYAVDAIDSLSPKVYFLKRCLEKKIPVISSMGSGGRVDPLSVKIADISKTYNCGLARATRQKLKKLGITKGIKTVFDPQNILNPNKLFTE